MAGPRHLSLPGSPPSGFWNFNDPDSIDLQLWEVPVESGSPHGGATPTVILPTLPVLNFLRHASRAAVGAMPLLTEPPSAQARGELCRLQEFVNVIEQLFEDPSGKRSLIITKLRLLEEIKSMHNGSGDDRLLFEFLDQAEAPQTYRYVDDRALHEGDESADEDEDIERSSGNSTAGAESDNSDASL